MIESYILDWLNLVIRWVHVITGIAWVGASFYFVWLLNRLLPDENGDPIGYIDEYDIKIESDQVLNQIKEYSSNNFLDSKTLINKK